MDNEVLEIDRRLADFDKRNSPAGLLERYAKGRVTNFASRQVLTLSGAAILVILASPVVGLIAVTIALTGEALDCLFLRTVPGRLERKESFRKLAALSTLTAMLQATTIAICVAIAWFTAPGDSGMFFSLAYLTGAAINGGIVLPFHRSASIGRLAVFGLSVCLLFGAEAIHAHEHSLYFFYNLLGGLMMCYMVVIFVTYVVSGQKREIKNSRNLIKQSRQIAFTSQSLVEHQKEARNLALVAKRAHDSVIMSDTKGRILWVNAAFTRITGYTLAESRGKLPSDLLNGPDTSEQISAEIAVAVQQGRAHRAEILNYTKDGRKVWMETNIASVMGDDGEVEMVIAIERDITASKTYERKLAQAKQTAELGEKAKSRFLATMSHEIRTPMNGIIGMADLLSEEELSEEKTIYVDTIKNSAEALLTLINDILDFSKLDAEKLVIHPVTFNLQTCIQDVVTLLGPQAYSKGITLDFLTTSALPKLVHGDDIRLRQILVNVIGNAVKFTETGHVHVTAQHRQVPEGLKLLVKVKDTGVGIPNDRLDYIFDQFSQADAATTRKFGGTGLGLAISRLLARNMGGDVTVQPIDSKGACFHIEILLSNDIDKHTQGSGEATHVNLDLLHGKTILLAEDNQTNRLLIVKYLKEQPINLLVAHNGKEAVDLTAQHQPDIVLMDMSMPVMDGLQATHCIRKATGRQPYILALTANAYASDRDACLKAGMDGFLSKPVRKKSLLNELAEICALQVPNRDVG